MRIALTGASGRLGRSVTAVLREAGHRVLSIDRTLLPGDEGEAVDLTDAAVTADVFGRFEPDAVVHLAAIAVPFSAPERTIFTTNTGMAYTVIEAAVAAGATARARRIQPHRARLRRSGMGTEGPAPRRG